MVYTVDNPEKKEMKKKKAKTRATAARTAKTPATNVRPKVAKLIERVVEENAPTRQELSKR